MEAAASSTVSHQQRCLATYHAALQTVGRPDVGPTLHSPGLSATLPIRHPAHPPHPWSASPAGMKTSSPGSTMQRSPPTRNSMRPCTTVTSSSSLHSGSRSMGGGGWIGGWAGGGWQWVSRQGTAAAADVAAADAPAAAKGLRRVCSPPSRSLVHKVGPFLPCRARRGGGKQAGRLAGRCVAGGVHLVAAACEHHPQPTGSPPPPPQPTAPQSLTGGIHKHVAAVAPWLPVPLDVALVHRSRKLVFSHCNVSRAGGWELPLKVGWGRPDAVAPLQAVLVLHHLPQDSQYS